MLAVDKVRWVGHPVAAVVAETLEAAEQAIDQVEIEYEPLPPLFNPADALKPDVPIIHEKMAEYRVSPAFKPIPGTNIANQFKLVRGDVERGFQGSISFSKANSIYPTLHTASWNFNRSLPITGKTEPWRSGLVLSRLSRLVTSWHCLWEYL